MGLNLQRTASHFPVSTCAFRWFPRIMTGSYPFADINVGATII